MVLQAPSALSSSGLGRRLNVVYGIDDGYAGLLYARGVEAWAGGDGRVAEQLFSHARLCCSSRLHVYRGGWCGGRLRCRGVCGLQIIVVALVGLTVGAFLLLLLGVLHVLIGTHAQNQRCHEEDGNGRENEVFVGAMVCVGAAAGMGREAGIGKSAR